MSLRLKFLSKSPLFFAPLLLLPYSLNSQALSAQTSSVIQGTAPYLTFDGGITKITTTNEMLTITLSDGTKISPQINNSATTPIVLPNVGETLADVRMLLPSSTNSIELNALIDAPYNYWGDADGDGQKGQVTATGSLSVAFTDKNGNIVGRTDTLDICNAPYKVTLNSTGGSLTTRYGIPNSSTFDVSTESYYINPNSPPKICFVKPNLQRGAGEFAGPTDIWNQDKGFLISGAYEGNFPTTGADGLYFDLDIAGGSALTWQSFVTQGGITVTVTKITSTTIRVTLKGPEARGQWNNNSPNEITKPTLPQTFELVGRDGRGNEMLKYGFKLQKWFVNRGSKQVDFSTHSMWCRKLGYRLAQIKDLTNANCAVIIGNSNCKGAIPSSSDNLYHRRIGGGLFSEWGKADDYTSSDFFFGRYWTSDEDKNNIGKFVVYSDSGHVGSHFPDINNYSICAYP